MTPCRESVVRKGPGYGAHRNQQYLHRWVWEQINGPIPAGMEVMHLCDNRRCFRYDHLRLGTHAENMGDMRAKRRDRNGKERDHCIHGHPYDEENTYWRRDRPGHRECRACRREATRRWWSPSAPTT